MEDPPEEAPAQNPADPELVDRLGRELGIGPESARRLVAAGFTDAAAVRGASPDDLLKAGLTPEEVDHLRAPAADAAGASSDDEAVGERMLSSVRAKGPPSRRRRPAAAGRSSTEVVKRWVDGDEGAMEAWIRSAPTMGSSVAEPPPPTTRAELAPPAPGAENPEGPTVPGPIAPAPDLALGTEIPAMLLDREQAVIGWLTELLDRARTDRFDPASLLTELQGLQRQLFEERARRAKIEEEAEQVKRGSVAVIKYVRAREAATREQALRERDAEIAALKLQLLPSGDGGKGPASPAIAAETEARLRTEFAEREAGQAEKETELRQRLAKADAELRELRGEAGNLKARAALLQEQERTLPEVVAAKLRELDNREKEIATREGDLRAKFDEIKAAADQLERQKEPMRFKEKQLGQWEVQLRTLKQTLEVEARTVERARFEVEQSGGTNPVERQRLDDLKNEITKREEALASRESLLKEQIQDLQSRAVAQGAEEMHAAATADARETRQSTGVRRLDDLLFGGLPSGAQVLVSGPAHTGKELLARLFVAEGLRRGIPAIWVVADKTFTQVREEMVQLLPSYRELEGRGLVRYVDLYSRSLGVTQSEPGVRLFQTTDRGVLDQLTQTVNSYSQELKEKAPTYRLVFESVSTVTAYLDTAAMFRFLQPFTGRRKLDGAAGYYLLETGMHTESDLETLEHMVDGSINLKVEQLKTFLSVRGVSDVQSRAWVGYTFTKRAFSLGSFSLDHIR